MIEIRRIQPDEWAAAKQVVYRVALVLFGRGRDLDTFITYHESIHELKDMDDIQKNYFENGGIFLVMFDDQRMICTSAIRRLQDDLCELKRLWLLTEYHGKGLGYRMMQELLTFARTKDYKRMQLETDAVAQSRAVEFYKRFGFHEVPNPNSTDTENIIMEMSL